MIKRYGRLLRLVEPIAARNRLRCKSILLTAHATHPLSRAQTRVSSAVEAGAAFPNHLVQIRHKAIAEIGQLGVIACGMDDGV